MLLKKMDRALRRVIRKPKTTIELLVLQPTPFCNINCSYCYLTDKNNKKRMSDDTLYHSFKTVFDSPYIGNSLSVVWHAGEPLVLPIEYYENAFRLINQANKNDIPVIHNIQTNGMLLNDNWSEFIAKNKIRVGVSVDGPKELHDAHRLTRSGLGTFEQTMAGIKTLQRNNIPFHVISVLTDKSLDRAKELFEFYVSNGIAQIGFNVEETEGCNKISTLNQSAVIEKYKLFLQHFIGLMKATPKAIELRELSGALQGILYSSLKNMANSQVEPFRIVNVGVNGELSTFSPEILGVQDEHWGDFVFGNVKENSLAEILTSNKFKSVNESIQAGVAMCEKECEYYALCGGGAPANKYFENGNFASTETQFCRLTKKVVIDVALEELEVQKYA